MLIYYSTDFLLAILSKGIFSGQGAKKTFRYNNASIDAEIP